MNVNLSIKAVPQELAERLRRRAERHHRSLQGELMAIIEAAAAEEIDAGSGRGLSAHAALAAGKVPPSPSAGARVQGWKTVEQLLAERLARGWMPHPSLAAVPPGVDIVRADRDSR